MNKHEILKLITVTIGAFMIPLGTFGGYKLGVGNYKMAIFIVAVQTLLAFIQSMVWWKTIETTKNFNP